jgi:hypothetical protein
MKTMKNLSLILISLVLFANNTFPQQTYTQTVRGKVIDKVTRFPLPGANVVILNSSPVIATVTDPEGNFRLAGIPIGRQSLQITYVGYKPSTIPNIVVNSAKEVVLEVEMEENVIVGEEVVIKANGKKDETLNKMASVSARMFTVEETEKFAGSRGDVARMAMNYAGVLAANDSRNDIIIRGNSPSGLLWRLDDVEIPNPNHFAENGTTGGPVGMLNNNQLMNSDFITGAFPAEYGNALSGVFDLKLRNGNNEKHEFLFQSGFNGFEAGAEGPFNKNHKSSYLINARYSTLELVSKVVDFGTAGVPKYKDVSFKLNFPMQKGRFTLFGVGGTSQIAMLDSKKTGKELYTSDGMDLYNKSATGVIGATYTHFLGTKTYIKLILSGISMNGGSDIDTLDDVNDQPHAYIHHHYLENRISSGLIVNAKISKKFNIKSGISFDKMGFNLKTEIFENENQAFRQVLNSSKQITSGPLLVRSYVATTYRFSDEISFNPGLQLMYFDLKDNYSLEPRMGISWQFKENQKISAGYGLHSKIQNLYTYYYLSRLPDNSFVRTNKNIDFTKSHQVVLGYDWSINRDIRLKLESYYQYLFNVPVEQRASSESILNTGAYWGPNTTDSLVNEGSGRNYGLELTLEKFFSKNYYYLMTVSLFDSKYKGSDNMERNTAFNGNYVVNALFGKEFKVKQKNAFTVDAKLTYAGGIRYTPIDSVSSRIRSEEVRFGNLAFSKQFPAFFKLDIKVGYRVNKKRSSHEWQVYVENVTNHKNFLAQQYNVRKNEVSTLYQLGFFPMVLYRVHF